MKQVIRYQCEFCKKEFKTPDRHYCKKNPKLKNCFTCKHLKGWLESEESALRICPDCHEELKEECDVYLLEL